MTRLLSPLFWFVGIDLATGFTSFLAPPSPLAVHRSAPETAHLCASSTKDTDGDSFFTSLLDRFQGDFDNYAQVVQDRENGLLPREGGGHEQIHCLLMPVDPVLHENDNSDAPSAARLAAFWFDGIPQRIFRFRYYQLTEGEENKDEVDMQLYCLNPTLEGKLRGIEDPMEWPKVVATFEKENDNVVDLLPKCDVQWSRQLDPVQHEYAQKRNDEKEDKDDLGIHAIMVHGQAIVDSTMMPGNKILIKDQLSLWEDQFWIHDRGFNPETMDFIYGNQRGVPYRLERLTNIVNDNGREVARKDLQWTMGPNWRTEEEYEAKLEVLGGGVSSQLNKK